MYTVAVHDRATRAVLAQHHYRTLHAALMGRVDLLIAYRGHPILVTSPMRGVSR